MVDVFEDLQNMCRLCCSTSSLVSIFDDRLESSENMAEIIAVTTGVKISPQDEISHKLCNKCSHLTIRMFKFRTASMLNDMDLREKAANQKAMKQSAMHKSIKDLFQQHPTLVLPSSILSQNVCPRIPLDKQDVMIYMRKARKQKSKKTGGFIQPATVNQSTGSGMVESIIEEAKTIVEAATTSTNSKSIAEVNQNKKENIDASDFTNQEQTKDDTCEDPPNKKPKQSDHGKGVLETLEKENRENGNFLLVKQTCKPLHICDVCNKVFYKTTDLKKHKNIHKRCSLCKTTFVSMEQTKEHEKNCLIRHVMSNQPNVNLRRCDQIQEIREKYKSAFEVLTVIEISDDEDEMEESLNIFSAAVPREFTEINCEKPGKSSTLKDGDAVSSSTVILTETNEDVVEEPHGDKMIERDVTKTVSSLKLYRKYPGVFQIAEENNGFLHSDMAKRKNQLDRSPSDPLDREPVVKLATEKGSSNVQSTPENHIILGAQKSQSEIKNMRGESDCFETIPSGISGPKSKKEGNSSSDIIQKTVIMSSLDRHETSNVEISTVTHESTETSVAVQQTCSIQNDSERTESTSSDVHRSGGAKRKRSKDQNTKKVKKIKIVDLTEGSCIQQIGPTNEPENPSQDSFQPQLTISDKDAMIIDSDDDDNVFLERLLKRIGKREDGVCKMTQTNVPCKNEIVRLKKGPLFELRNLRNNLVFFNIPVNITNGKDISIKYTHEPSYLKKNQLKLQSKPKCRTSTGSNNRNDKNANSSKSFVEKTSISSLRCDEIENTQSVQKQNQDNGVVTTKDSGTEKDCVTTTRILVNGVESNQNLVSRNKSDNECGIQQNLEIHADSKSEGLNNAHRNIKVIVATHQGSGTNPNGKKIVARRELKNRKDVIHNMDCDKTTAQVCLGEQIKITESRNLLSIEDENSEIVAKLVEIGKTLDTKSNETQYTDSTLSAQSRIESKNSLAAMKVVEIASQQLHSAQSRHKESNESTLKVVHSTKQSNTDPTKGNQNGNMKQNQVVSILKQLPRMNTAEVISDSRLPPTLIPVTTQSPNLMPVSTRPMTIIPVSEQLTNLMAVSTQNSITNTVNILNPTIPTSSNCTVTSRDLYNNSIILPNNIINQTRSIVSNASNMPIVAYPMNNILMQSSNPIQRSQGPLYLVQNTNTMTLMSQNHFQASNIPEFSVSNLFNYSSPAITSNSCTPKPISTLSFEYQAASTSTAPPTPTTNNSHAQYVNKSTPVQRTTVAPLSSSGSGQVSAQPVFASPKLPILRRIPKTFSKIRSSPSGNNSNVPVASREPPNNCDKLGPKETKSFMVPGRQSVQTASTPEATKYIRVRNLADLK